MTTLYRSVLIESAEQAEALPEGTVAISEEFAPEVFTKDGGSWLGTHGPGEFTNLSAVGLTALVPIEAEEERARSQINITHLPPPAPQMVPVRLPCPRCGLR